MRLSGTNSALADVVSDLLAVPVHADRFKESAAIRALDERLSGLVYKLAAEERFEGKLGQTLALHTHGKLGAQRLLLVGMGKSGATELAELRHAAATGVRAASAAGARCYAYALPEGAADDASAQLAAEGVLLGAYRFDRYLSGDAKRPETVVEVLFVGADSAPSAAALARAEIIAGAVAQARSMINEPAAEMTPSKMADVAREVAAKHGLAIAVLDRAGCHALGMGMFLAVSQGSIEEPRFIHLTYTPKAKATRRVCLIGKGVTFDSGGLSLKPSASMEDMKIDMSGAAAVIAAIGAIAAIGSDVEVHAIAACTENMPSGSAYKLGDVLRSMAGKTVEINNTDAEGRLTLGDAITYARRLEPDEIFDFATLTGAIVVALGPYTAGVMSNTPALSDRWLAAAKAAGEEMWPMPLVDRLKEQLKSDIADMKNTGERYGGAITAGLFLREFAGETPWVHVDLAGPASATKQQGATGKGGTGFAVATMVEYLAPRRG